MSSSSNPLQVPLNFWQLRRKSCAKGNNSNKEPRASSPDSKESGTVIGDCNHCATPGHYWCKCPYQHQKRSKAATIAATTTPLFISSWSIPSSPWLSTVPPAAPVSFLFICKDLLDLRYPWNCRCSLTTNWKVLQVALMIQLVHPLPACPSLGAIWSFPLVEQHLVLTIKLSTIA